MFWTKRTIWVVMTCATTSACAVDRDPPRDEPENTSAPKAPSTKRGTLLCAEDAPTMTRVALTWEIQGQRAQLVAHNATPDAMTARVELFGFDGDREVRLPLGDFSIDGHASLTIPVPSDAFPELDAKAIQLRARADAFLSPSDALRAGRSFSDKIEVRAGIVTPVLADDTPFFDPGGTLSEADREAVRKALPRSPGVSSEGVFVDVTVSREQMLQARHLTPEGTRP